MALSSSSISSTRSRLLPMVAAATSSSFSRCYSVARKPIISAASSAWLGRRFLQPKVPIGLSKPVFRNNILAAGRTFASVSINDRTIYEFTVKDISGNDVDLSIYKGKVLLFVNVASECGMTKRNYTELAELYRRYKDKGFEVLAFPCNQFGAQEPGTNEQIKEFACTNFKVEFPIFAKVEVNGPNAAPLYQYLREARKELLSDEVKWNFGKFLVNRNGKPVKRYAPTQNPSQIEGDIVKYLAM